MEANPNEMLYCYKCSHPDILDNLVKCCGCVVMFHYTCAGIDPSNRNPNISWKCNKCKLLAIAEEGSIKSGKSRSSGRSKTSQQQLQLCLQQLEEEKTMMMKHLDEEEVARKKAEQADNEARTKRMEIERRLLQEKYSLLTAGADDGASRRSGISSRASREKVQIWLSRGQGRNLSQEAPHHTDQAEVQRPANASSVTQIDASAEATIVDPPVGLNIPGQSAQQCSMLQVEKVPPSSTSTPQCSQKGGSGLKTANQPKVSVSVPLEISSASSFPKPTPTFTTAHGGQATNPTYGLPTNPHLATGFAPPATTSLYVPGSGLVRPVPVIPIPAPQIVSNPAIAGGFLGGVTTCGASGVPAFSHSSQSAPLIFNPQHPSSVQPNPLNVNPLQIGTGPSPMQIAARQVVARDLPKFTGDPEEWPMFYSAFCNTTEACGYSDAENLARLQRCLEGPALASVKSRLLLPKSVPYVIGILQRLYGRPEILIHSLLAKLREVPAPKADNLRSVIDFGLAVQNLVDHMTLSRLNEHLCNPMLLHELVEKLPAIWKMQWSSFKRTKSNANLATFGIFMSELVNTASDVTLPDLSASSSKAVKPNRNKSKLYVHSEDTKDQRESSNQKSADGPPRKTCAYCSNESHEILACAQFKALDLDARWKAMRQKGLCRNCLVPHRKWPCRSSKECGVDSCRFRHHPLLHSRPAANTIQRANTSPGSSGNGAVAHQNVHHALPCTLFRYLPVTIEGNGKQCHTFAFLDDGSSSTLIEANIASELGIEGQTDSLWLNWTGNVSREEKGSQRVSIVINGRGLKNRYQLENVRTVQKLNLPEQTLRYNELKERYPHLRGLPAQDYSEAVPGIIIGLEHVRLLTTLKLREGKSDDPVAAKTRLGWCIFGRQSIDNSSVEQLHHHYEKQMSNRELHERMKRFFGIEEASVTVKPEAEVDKRAKEIMESTTRRVGMAFETGLVWKHDNICFPNNYKMAESRLVALERRLAKDPALYENVKEQIAAYEEKGYAHRITEEELHSSDPNRIWYLPLSVVQNPKKPGKVRLIWDAAARFCGVSLNDMLLKGPDLLVALIEILLRFRQKSIAICGDIREMFHQLLIRFADKQAQRFLWRNFPDLLPQIFVMDVATFGATCSPRSAQFVKNKNAREYATEYPRAVDAIINSHYVDDYLDSVDTVDEAVQLWNEVKFVHSQGGFDIRNFISNSVEVMRRVGENGNMCSKSMNLDQINDTERVLGMVWKPTEDIFTFDPALKPEIAKLLAEHGVPTKRQVLRTVMSIFDPLGLIAHFIVQGKIVMHDVWRSGTDWDEPIADNIHEKWHRWSQLLLELNTVQVPRCFFSGVSREAFINVQIHVLVDASPDAYACVAYLRIVDGGVPRCALIAAKTKVAPLKPLSIPRLELQAAMIGSRLLDNICQSLSITIHQRFLWADSCTVLSWLRSDSRRYHPFVAFRVYEILSLTTVDEWRHVPSKHNVADDATKWGSGPCFDPEYPWFRGPPFLLQNEDSWPPSTAEVHPVTEELRAAYTHSHVVYESLVAASRFSKWERMLRTTAYVLRSVRRVKGETFAELLSSEELRNAEDLLLRQVQMERFPDEYAALHHNKTQPDKEPFILPKSSHLYQLTPYLDDAGVIRMNSRIGAALNAPFQAKYPILLPKNHRITTLLVDSYHRRFLHENNETVLNEVRQRFHIPSLRTVIRRVSKECQKCRVIKATPCPPQMAPLPIERLTPFIRPFTHTGVDYFGPLLVNQGRGVVKRWVALFTCLSVRAVNLEVVHSLTVQSCVMAIRRFIARRGAPESFHSDNGTNFIGASNLLKTQLKEIDSRCAETFTNASTSWHFNPPSAPHMGGAWERLVRSVKNAMTAINDHPHHPSDEVLETVALEAEAVVNSRPLTYVPLDSSDDEALTPNHFILYGTHGVNQPSKPLTEGISTLRDSWKLAQCLLDGFWRRWIREYLPELTRRTRWYQPVKPLEVGDVVMVVDESKRNGWIRGRVIEAVRGKGGQVRRAKVHTANGTVIRPAVKIAVLDVIRPTPDVDLGSPGTTREGECCQTHWATKRNRDNSSVSSGRSQTYSIEHV